MGAFDRVLFNFNPPLAASSSVQQAILVEGMKTRK